MICAEVIFGHGLASTAADGQTEWLDNDCVVYRIGYDRGDSIIPRPRCNHKAWIAMAKKSAETSSAPQIIYDLVAKFAEHQEQYQRGDYNETQLRRDFLDPFFAAMAGTLTTARDTPKSSAK